MITRSTAARYVVWGTVADHSRHGCPVSGCRCLGRFLSFLLCYFFPACLGVERVFRPFACRAADAERAGFLKVMGIEVKEGREDIRSGVSFRGELL